MKTIEVDEELYRYIASQTQHIGESASDILRRLLGATPQSLTCQADEVSVEPMAAAEASPASLPDADTLAAEESSIGRFMLILTALYRSQPEAFAQAAELKGRKRLYIARTPEELQANGTTTKPKPIPDTPFWVISNTNTARKRHIISQVMTAMAYPADQIEQVCDKV
ncbi:replication initiation negative regulator SeqA [Pseudaeromonas paramecii]|uniref:Negative modulator of initiation of replication n=1 Tax=Pseudaeromonas paramecii TaxID=2138166 RepID=A0ABP8Q995_9GAMM